MRWRKSPRRRAEANGNTVGFRRACGGPTDRHQPKPKRLDWDDAGQGYLYLYVPRRRLVSNEFPLRQGFGRAIDLLSQDHISATNNGLGEIRTPTSFRTPAPKTDASAIPPRGLTICQSSTGQLLSCNYQTWGRCCQEEGDHATASVPCRESAGGLAALTGRNTRRHGRKYSSCESSPRELSRGCRDRGRRPRRLCGGAGGASKRPHGRVDRGDRLDRRPAHVPGRAARRTSLDRAIRGVGLVPEAASEDPRLLSAALSH